MLKNSRHELYAQGLFQGKTSIQAYEDAGFIRNHANASTLRSNQKVIDRVAELHARTVTSINISQEWIRERLVDVVVTCLSYEKIDSSGANKALHLLGLDHGMFVERAEVGKPGAFDGLSIADRKERIMGVLQQLGLAPVSADGRLRLGAGASLLLTDDGGSK